MGPSSEVSLMTAEAFFDWVQRPENQGRHYELESGKVVEGEQDLTGGDVLPGLRCPLADVFFVASE